jgi:UDP-glucose 6-dehydrogenase
MTIGIVGANGFVGTAMSKLFPNALKFGRESNQKLINSCDVIFICVPTNLKSNWSLDTSIVEDVVKRCESPLIIIRSTLNPGTSDYLEKKYKKLISMVPEYVGETVAHPLLDESTRPFLIIGGSVEARKRVIQLYTTVYNSNVKIRQVTNYESEVIKLSENRAIAFKVMQLHELYLTCEKAGLDYYTIRDSVYGDDPRFNLWFSFIYEHKLGFNNSKCLVKDIPAWCHWAKSIGLNPELTEILVRKSHEYEKL